MSVSARRWAWGSLVAIVAAVALALVVLVAVRWEAGRGGSFSVDAPVAVTDIEPRGALVGDRLKARARVLVDTDRIDPDTVRLSPRFAPFGLVSIERSVQEGIGHTALVEVTYTLHCVTVDCLYAMERVVDGQTVDRPIVLPEGRIATRTREGAVAQSPLRWPAINLRSRLDQEQIDLLETRPASFRRPPVSYAVSPAVLGWGSTALALGLLGVAAWLVAGVVRRRILPRTLRIPEGMTGVERALALVQHARETGDVAGERRALERLAVELRRDGDAGGSAAARRLAWSKDGLEDDAVDHLASELATADRGR